MGETEESKGVPLKPSPFASPCNHELSEHPRTCMISGRAKNRSHISSTGTPKRCVSCIQRVASDGLSDDQMHGKRMPIAMLFDRARCHSLIRRANMGSSDVAGAPRRPTTGQTCDVRGPVRGVSGHASSAGRLKQGGDVHARAPAPSWLLPPAAQMSVAGRHFQ